MNTCCVDSLPFATTTPPDYPIADAFGYTTGGNNFPGLISLSFPQKTSIAGFSISGQVSLLALSWPALATITSPTTGNLSISGNPALTSIYAPALTRALGIMIASNAVLPAVDFAAVTTLETLTVQSNPLVASVAFGALLTHTNTGQPLTINLNPALLSINLNVLNSSANGLLLSSNVSLVSVALSALAFSGSTINLSGDIKLTSLTLPALVTAGGSASSTAINCSGCTLLASVSFPNYLPTNGKTQNFSGCALTQASVDHVLARCVANAAYVSGTVNTSGGTSAAPGTQGQLDKAVLIARGCVVLTN